MSRRFFGREIAIRIESWGRWECKVLLKIWRMSEHCRPFGWYRQWMYRVLSSSFFGLSWSWRRESKVEAAFVRIWVSVCRLCPLLTSLWISFDSSLKLLWGVLEPISSNFTKDEALKAAWRMCWKGRDVKVQVHWFLISFYFYPWII
jgi:hypothetical protein